MSTLPACLQPRLGLEVFGFVPPGCFGFYVDNDESDPVIREGETAVIDVMNRQLEDGALFLIEWSTGERDIVQAYRKGYTDARTGREEFRWWVASYNRPRSRQKVEAAIRAGRTLSTSDGPYADDGVHLAEKIIGKVAGILAPDRHSDDELRRLRDVARCPAHILASGYGARPVGYIEPAGSRRYCARGRGMGARESQLVVLLIAGGECESACGRRRAMSDERVRAVVEEFIRTHPEADADECRRYAVHEVTLTRTPMGGGPQVTKVELGIGPLRLADFIRQNLND